MSDSPFLWLFGSEAVYGKTETLIRALHVSTDTGNLF
jgi:hypothetical protein